MDGVDGCFHLAAVASVQRGNEDWVGTHRANLTGAITVFDAARHCRAGESVPVVYASSAAVYGDNPNVPLTEHSQIQPLSAYGADKLGCELHARVATLVHGVPTTGFRFFNVYGPRQDPFSPYSGVIAIFSERLAKGGGVTIHGDGEQTRDFVYVADVVRYLVAAMDNQLKRPSDDAAVFNICTGRPTSITQLAGIIARLNGRAADITYGEARPGDVRVSIGDPTRVQQAFGFSADTMLDDGLAQTLGLEPV
jgi:UDP-glucose 4-epimerase